MIVCWEYTVRLSQQLVVRMVVAAVAGATMLTIALYVSVYSVVHQRLAALLFYEWLIATSQPSHRITITRVEERHQEVWPDVTLLAVP